MAASVAVGSFLVILVCKLLTLALEKAWPSIVRPPGVQSVVELAEEVKNLRQQHKELNHPDTFVQASKVKRKLNATEAQLERAKKEAGSISHNHNKNFLLAVIKALGPGLLVISWWGKAVVSLSPSVLWPLAGPLAFPNHEPGVIGVLPWIFICQQCVGRVVDLGAGMVEGTEQVKASWKALSAPNKVEVKLPEGDADAAAPAAQTQKQE